MKINYNKASENCRGEHSHRGNYIYVRSVINKTQRRKDTEFLFLTTDSTDQRDYLAYARD